MEENKEKKELQGDIRRLKHRKLVKFATGVQKVGKKIKKGIQERRRREAMMTPAQKKDRAKRRKGQDQFLNELLGI